MRTIRHLLLATAFLATTALHSSFHPPGPVKEKVEVSTTIKADLYVFQSCPTVEFSAATYAPFVKADGYRKQRRPWRTLARNGQKPQYNSPPVDILLRPVNTEIAKNDVTYHKELHVDPGICETTRSDI